MKISMISFTCALAATTVFAQSNLGSSSTDAASSGGSAGGDDEKAKAAVLPIAPQLGGRYYAEGPSGAREWGLRFQISFLFPK